VWLVSEDNPASIVVRRITDAINAFVLEEERLRNLRMISWDGL